MKMGVKTKQKMHRNINPSPSHAGQWYLMWGLNPENYGWSQWELGILISRWKTQSVQSKNVQHNWNYELVGSQNFNKSLPKYSKWCFLTVPLFLRGSTLSAGKPRRMSLDLCVWTTPSAPRNLRGRDFGSCMVWDPFHPFQRHENGMDSHIDIYIYGEDGMD